ncbi:MAG: hypothetical protein GY787_07725 [Alteromonadales bacterium]|nr:hypothetical protein [Alteromonadales bacterium]
MNNKEIEFWAREFESSVNKLVSDGHHEYEAFGGYFGELLELAKNQCINEPVEVNTAGASRYWFSETRLMDYPPVVTAFWNLVRCLNGKPINS